MKTHKMCVSKLILACNLNKIKRRFASALDFLSSKVYDTLSCFGKQFVTLYIYYAS